MLFDGTGWVLTPGSDWHQCLELIHPHNDEESRSWLKNTKTKKPTCDFLGLTMGNYKSSPWVPHGEGCPSCPPGLGTQFSSVSVVSNSLWPHGLQHTRPPCPSPTPGAYSNSCPPSQWCHPTISSSVVRFSSHLQSFPASGSFPKSQFFALDGQSTGVSASASVLPMNIHDWFSSEWTNWSSCSPRDSQEPFPTPKFKVINSLVLSFLYSPTLTSIHDYWKNHSFN